MGSKITNMIPFQKSFALLPQVNFPTNNLNFQWKWRWWKWIQVIFLNLLYFTDCWAMHKNWSIQRLLSLTGTLYHSSILNWSKSPHRLGLMRTTNILQFKKLPACQNLPLWPYRSYLVGIWWIIRWCQSDKTGLQYIFSGRRILMDTLTTYSVGRKSRRPTRTPIGSP